jgi:hypothetical protein
MVTIGVRPAGIAAGQHPAHTNAPSSRTQPVDPSSACRYESERACTCSRDTCTRVGFPRGDARARESCAAAERRNIVQSRRENQRRVYTPRPRRLGRNSLRLVVTELRLFTNSPMELALRDERAIGSVWSRRCRRLGAQKGSSIDLPLPLFSFVASIKRQSAARPCHVCPLSLSLSVSSACSSVCRPVCLFVDLPVGQSCRTLFLTLLLWQSPFSRSIIFIPAAIQWKLIRYPVFASSRDRIGERELTFRQNGKST